MAGVKDRVAGITERAMNGELDFQAALTERVALLKGLPESVLQQVYDERVRPMPGAKALLATMRAHGAHTVLVSGGFTYFTTRVRDELGFHEERSNTLEIIDGVLTGRVIPPIIDKQAKLQALIDSAAERGIALPDTLAAGDGANDLPMIQAAGLGVAYHAKAVVQASAGAALSHNDLIGLLYFQGYTKEQISA
jgi:phosphoserine phosphatase